MQESKLSIIFLKRSLELKPDDSDRVLCLIKEYIKMNNLLCQSKVGQWKENDQIWVPTEKKFIWTFCYELYKKSNFPFRNSLVNATKSTISGGFYNIYWSADTLYWLLIWYLVTLQITLRPLKFFKDFQNWRCLLLSISKSILTFMTSLTKLYYKIFHCLVNTFRYLVHFHYRSFSHGLTI